MSLEAIKKSACEKAIILGSGVSVYEGKEPIASISYADIPGWPLGKVKGHKGVLDIYEELWVLRGRAHLYEGFTWQQACFPTQFIVDNGIKELIVTNSAGGINSSYQVGDLMQITGYLDFIRPGKKRGNLEALTQQVIKFDTDKLATEHHGNYVAVHGPNYESDAEVALFRKLGADAVGMSTAPELEVAIANQLKITAISVITNVYGKTEDLGHEGVLLAAKNASAKLTKLLGIN
ncbi:MAG: purine-nucleoside phosphorylase [Cyanobacteria bacterium]|nr:purine-nucleoside phosphorylase [Cyanobacteriota bacterium]MDA1020757.1 purine-nucleoside phosphorylase [Cyanobacteriota bacterium]